MLPKSSTPEVDWRNFQNNNYENIIHDNPFNDIK